MSKEKTKSFAEMMGESLTPKQKAECDYWAPLSSVIIECIHLRAKNKITIEEAAKKIGMSKRKVAKFENLSIKNPTFDFLSKYAEAIGGKFSMTFGWKRDEQ